MPQARKIGTIAAGASGPPLGGASRPPWSWIESDRSPQFTRCRGATRCGEMPDPRGPFNHLSILKRAAYPEK